MPNLTPLEAAKTLEHLANVDYVDYDDAIEAMRVGSKFLRAIAAGEYKQVILCDKCVYGDYCKRHVNIVADADSIRPVTFCSAGKRKDRDSS
jgi:hypothetical protein